MDNTGNSKSRRNLLLKIIIPAVVVIIIAGIWLAKNYTNKPENVEILNDDFALEVTENIDLDKLKSYGLPIIIDFGADSCAPCKEMAPVLEELNEELQGKAIIRFVDVWKYPDIGKDYPVKVIPTQIFFDSEGKPYSPVEPEALQLLLYQSRDTGQHVFTAHEGGITKAMMLAILRNMGMKP